ncbi:MAG: OmpA family protein [Leptospirales bacterium]
MNLKIIRNSFIFAIVVFTTGLSDTYAENSIGLNPLTGKTGPGFQVNNEFESQGVNPGAAGFIEKFTIGGGYFNYGNYASAWSAVVLPISIANVSIQYARETSQLNSDFTNSIFIGYSKSYLGVLSIGIQTSLHVANTGEYQVGINPGFVYRGNFINGKSMNGFFTGWYFYSNLDYRFVDNFSAKMNTGFVFDIYKNAVFSTRILAESKAPDFNSQTYPFLVALGFTWQSVSFRTGYYFTSTNTNSNNNDSRVGAGIGYSPAFSIHNFSLNYGINMGLSTGADFNHSISLSGSFGHVDKIPPNVKIQKLTQHLSPNGDGVKDFIWFEIGLQGTNRLNDWRLEIKNSHGKIVKTFRKDKREMIRNALPGAVITGFFSKKVYEDIPKKIFWAGTRDGDYTQNIESESDDLFFLPEGRYTYNLSVTDQSGNVNDQVNGEVFIDKTPPDISLDVRRNYIKPGSRDSFRKIKIYQRARKDTGVKYSSQIIDAQGGIIQSVLWKNYPDRDASWDGKNEEGEIVPPGRYFYIFQATDLAGNTTRLKSRPVYVIENDTPLVYIESNKQDFNPEKHQLLLSPYADKKRSLAHWNIFIGEMAKNENSEPTIIKQWSGDRTDLPDSLKWDPKEDMAISDTELQIWFEVEYKNGTSVISPPIRIEFDTQAPTANVRTIRKKFSPDGDGVSDTEIFYISMKDKVEIKNYKLTIYEVIPGAVDKAEEVFRQWEGKGRFTGKIYWDGLSQDGLYVQSKHVYRYQLTVTDNSGNIYSSRKKSILSEVLFFNDVDNLKVILTSADFVYKSHKIKPQAHAVLNRFVRLLKKYPTYRIRVEVHTSEGGEEESNIILSEKRAKTVMLYLGNKGISRERLAYQGLGNIRPIRKGEEKTDTYKNERVELILIR